MHGSPLHDRPARDAIAYALVVGMLAALLAASAYGQVPPPVNVAPPMEGEAAPPSLTQQSVQDRLKRLDESTDLDAATKDKLRDIYKQALDQLRVAGEWADKAAKTEAARQSDPQDVARLKAELAVPAVEPKIEIPANGSLAQLNQSLASAEEQLKAEQAKLAYWDVLPKRRREEVPRQVAAAKQRLADVDQELAALPPGSDAIDLPQARRTLLVAIKAAAQQELAAQEKERLRFEASPDLAPLERDMAVRRVGQAEAIVKKWRDAVNDFRRQEAEEQARQARWAAVSTYPELKALAEENARLTAEQNGPEGLPAKIERADQEKEALQNELAQLRSQFTSVQEKIKAAGLTDAIGLLLRKRLADLPDVRAHQQSIRARQAEISRVQAKLIELEDERADLANLEPQVRRYMQAIDARDSASDPEDIELKLRELLENKRAYLRKQIADATAYVNTLALDLDVTERQLIAETQAYTQFINEKILWIRSAAALSGGDLTRAGHAVARWLDPQAWRDLARALWNDALANPLVYLAAIVLAVPLLIFQWRLRRRITYINEQTAKDYAATIGPTFAVLFLTLLIAAIWPSLMLFVAWRLAAPVDMTPFARAVAFGLATAAVIGLPTELLRQICRRKGLAEVHFRWPESALVSLRKNLRWLLSLGLPTAFVVALAEGSDREPDKASLGRLAFMVGMLLLAIFAHRVLRPQGGILHSSGSEGGGWLVRTAGLWHVLAIGAPLTLLVIAALGYYYTALELVWRLQATLWLVLGLSILRALALRWLLIARRKLAIKQARQRRIAAQAQSSQARAAGGEAAAATSTPTKDEVDLGTIDVQTRRLLRSFVGLAVIAGCWLIWVDVLPALAVLDQWKLWPYTSEVAEVAEGGASALTGLVAPVSGSGTSNAASPTPAPATTATPSPGTLTMATRVTQTKWITVKDLIVGAVVVLMTFVASRNLPGLLEISVLQRLPLDPGGRYAITTVSRYLITLVGIVVAFWVIGIGWSNVQWLVAAITVGLGFGLQEIFANFISGIIILFERPMRVGDIVTVGGVSGKVARIRIRATTITDWDRKELIVPNREFITGQLVNWTLSDSILRTVIRVGIAYGSDTELARQLLLKVAREDQHVLDDPPPVAVFDQFGDSTLDFDLRVFAPIEQFLTLRHDLNTAIDRAFREAGIEIAFPQRDLHIRSIEPVVPIADRRAAHRES
jgi:potassium-dependent mechanosensitive channel